MGYTPAFDTLYTGTLCGRWPEAAVMASLLPLIDARGEINMSYAAIHALTGWPMDLLEQGIKQLMEPDAYSRSPDHDGRRLVLLEPARPWGWRVVNHAKYREKARKAAFDAERTASGANAARMAARRQTREPEDRPDETRGDPLSDSDTDSNKREEGATRRVPPPAQIPIGLDLIAWDRWKDYRRQVKKPIRPASEQSAMSALAKFGPEQAAVVEQSIANGWQGLFELREVAKKKSQGEWR